MTKPKKRKTPRRTQSEETKRHHHNPKEQSIGNSTSAHDTMEDHLQQLSNHLSKRLNPDHLSDFEHLLQAYRYTSQSLGAIVAIQDLYPFITRLNQLLESKDFDDTLNIYEYYNEFDKELRRVRSYLWTALRNRTETSDAMVNSSIPGTLGNGCAKLLPAYAAACKMASKVLGLFEGQAETCVIRGIAGRLECHELFEPLRMLQLNSDSIDSKRENKTRSQLKRLLLIQISGPILLKPEVACTWPATKNLIHEL